MGAFRERCTYDYSGGAVQVTQGGVVCVSVDGDSLFLLLPAKHDTNWSYHPHVAQRAGYESRIANEKPIIRVKRHRCTGVYFLVSGVHAESGCE